MTKLKKVLLFSIGLTIIVSYLYLRIILQREDKNLDFYYIKNNIININYYILAFISFFFIISIIALIVITKIYFNSKLNVPKNKITSFMLNILEIIKESLLAVNDAIADYIPNSYEKLKTVVLLFYKYFNTRDLLLIYTFYIIPYMSLGISFMVDIFVFYKLHYFYKILPIIMLPLFFNIFLFLIKELLKNMDYIKEKITITHCILNNGKDHFTFTPNFDLIDDESGIIFTNYVNEYLCLYPIKSFLDYFSTKEFSYKLFGLSFMYCSYFIACIYLYYISLYSLIMYIL